MTYFLYLVVLASVAYTLAHQIHRLVTTGLFVTPEEVNNQATLRSLLGDFGTAVLQGVVAIITWGSTAWALVVLGHLIPALAAAAMTAYLVSGLFGIVAMSQLWSASSRLLERRGLRVCRRARIVVA